MPGNGIPGSVTAALQPGDYSWSIHSQDLPGQVLTGVFPNAQNSRAIQSQTWAVLWPMRAGLNQPAPVFAQRPRTGIVGVTAVGLGIQAAESQIRVAGLRGTTWTVDAVQAQVDGQDEYGGTVNSDGAYVYRTMEFVNTPAWASITGFMDGYRHLDGHSKILGWALDGYPIYGPWGYDMPASATSLVVPMTSSYALAQVADRPGTTKLLTRGIVVKSSVITVTNASTVAPGMVLTGGSLPGPVKVLAVSNNNLVLDTRVNLDTNVSIQGHWPLGIFCEDYVYQPGSGTLDRHNGRFCVTPEYPQGTYAYFATLDDQGPVYPYILGNTLYGARLPTAPVPPEPLTWITLAGELGTVPVDLYYAIQLQAQSLGAQVHYEIIAGALPDGLRLADAGLLSGVPTLSDAGQLGLDVASKFVVRAYTLIPGTTRVSEFLDRTFTITVPGRSLPKFAQSGNIGTFYDGAPITPIQLTFTAPLYNTQVRLAAGQLPPGLTVSATGLISGYIAPLTQSSNTPGYDITPEDVYGYDFLAQSENVNYQFTLEITDGRAANLTTFEIYVYSRNTLTADDALMTADTTMVTADETPDRLPFMITPEGFLGSYEGDNFFAFKFDAVDLDGQNVEYVLVVDHGPGYNYSIPPGLNLDPVTGWLYGYLTPQNQAAINYTLAIRIRNAQNHSIMTAPYIYTLTITDSLAVTVNWVTDADLGTIDNGSVSLLSVRAQSVANRDLIYRLVPGSDSRLPAGLRLLPTGEIAGTVSYDTFALDTGTTTFDTSAASTGTATPTTFDLTYKFLVNAYSPVSEQVQYTVQSLTVQYGGETYANPTVTIAPPAGTGVAALAGTATLEFIAGRGYVIESVNVVSGGVGYLTAPEVTVTDSTGSGAIITANIVPATNEYLISATREFQVRVNRVYQEPLDTLYIEGLLPDQDRQMLTNLTQNVSLIPWADRFRANDPNFGVAQRLIYAHAYGLRAATAQEYQASLSLNHYWKQLMLGLVSTARAVDAQGTVIYEVIYCPIQDDLVNNQGQSVSKAVTLDHPVTYQGGTEVITTVYPNSLVDMREQVIDQIGQISTVLPLWMTSIQPNGQQLGYVPAWVIAYVKPGRAAQIAYYINQQFANSFNQIDFEVDRYVLGRQLSANWDSQAQAGQGQWVPKANATTFDLELHYRLTGGVIAQAGHGYAQGDVLSIPGSWLGGFDGYNDLTITVMQVGDIGDILYVRLTGQATPLTLGNAYTGIVATTVTGHGTGATWNLLVASGDVTVFDGGGLTFTVPTDIYGVTDQYNKYLVFPKRTILD